MFNKVWTQHLTRVINSRVKINCYISCYGFFLNSEGNPICLESFIMSLKFRIGLLFLIVSYKNSLIIYTTLLKVSGDFSVKFDGTSTLNTNSLLFLFFLTFLGSGIGFYFISFNTLERFSNFSIYLSSDLSIILDLDFFSEVVGLNPYL